MKKYVYISMAPTIKSWYQFMDADNSQFSCDSTYNRDEFDSVLETYVKEYEELITGLKNWEVYFNDSSIDEINTIFKRKEDADLMESNIEIQKFYDSLSDEQFADGEINTTYYPGTYTHYSGGNLPPGGYYEPDEKDVSIEVELIIKNDDLTMVWGDDPDSF